MLLPINLSVSSNGATHFLELGIDFGHIRKKVIIVINPFKHCMDTQMNQDADLAGPLFFAIFLGCLLLLVWCLVLLK